MSKGIMKLLAGVACLALASAWGGTALGDPVTLQFQTELLSLNLNGGPFNMPLGAGWTDVLSSVNITESSTLASTGMAIASNFGEGEVAFLLNGATPIDPASHDGEQFFVNSFFDVFFDITVTDVDPANNFAGMPDGASIKLPGNGPAKMQSFYSKLFDMNAPNFGLIPPPEVAPYIGHFNIEIFLGADLNGNGENDKLKFTLATHSVGDENRTFITLPDGTVIDSFDSTASLEGAIVDESQDPPFTIGPLTGPTTASSRLLNPIGPAVPEPATLALVGLGLAGMGAWRSRRGRKA